MFVSEGAESTFGTLEPQAISATQLRRNVARATRRFPRSNHDRYEIYVLEDCCGDVSQLAHDNAMKRVIQAGAKPVTVTFHHAGVPARLG